MPRRIQITQHCVRVFIAFLQEQIKSVGAGVKTFSGRAGTFTGLLYCFNMSFTPSLKRPRCETDGILMKIKESAVERHGRAFVGWGAVVCFGERVLGGVRSGGFISSRRSRRPDG